MKCKNGHCILRMTRETLLTGRVAIRPIIIA